MIGAGKDPRNRLRGPELKKYGESKLWDKAERANNKTNGVKRK